MTTFIHRKSKRSGIQFDGSNREKIIDFLGIDKQYCELWRREDSDECHLIVRAPGIELGLIEVKDWILVGPNNTSYIVINEDTLEQEYEEI